MSDNDGIKTSDKEDHSMAQDVIAKAVDAFLRDDIAAFESNPELEAIAINIVATFARGKGRRQMATLDKSKSDEVLDIIMSRACPTESLEMSLSRLSAAVGILGFKSITKFAAYAAYKSFPQLSQPMKKMQKDGKRT